MTNFPTSIFTPRATENLPGITYDPTQKQNMFSEDFQNLGAEITAIETALGISLVNFKALFREKLTADRNYYVRTDGNNSNTGLTNISGGAFLTIQKAIDTVASLDCSIYNVYINVADGTYTGNNYLKNFIGSGIVLIQGNITTPTNCIISVTGDPFTATNLYGRYQIKGFKLNFTTGTGFRLTGSPTYVAFGNIYFNGGGGVAVMSWGFGCKVEAIGPFTLSGAYWSVLYALEGGFIVVTGNTVTCITGLSFSAHFAYCERGIACIDIFSMTFIGSATGSRYNSQNNSVIFTNGGGATYLPGNVAGSVINGGIYV